MIKNLMRAVSAAALAVLPLTTATPAHAVETLPLAQAVKAVPLAAESREGYQRTSFKHWNAGQIPSDGCNTRAEVLLSEATQIPQILPGCKLSGGMWWSYYDAKWITSASALDVDHMVPLAEAWDSGASQWTAERREAYANDLGSERSLVAVSAASNRSKADQDPAEWLPPATEVTCRYLSEWTATKLRWGLTLDIAEQEALTQLAEACPTTTVTYERAP
ncbi:HNH endonuclease family protein [Streptomyces sp. NPDC002054]|uniref:HNH endonuclease family protein n=1 Tax=Streptomyces sp. NPDC002054 TaxID=3154663 RepID=UPI0033299DC4